MPGTSAFRRTTGAFIVLHCLGCVDGKVYLIVTTGKSRNVPFVSLLLKITSEDSRRFSPAADTVYVAHRSITRPATNLTHQTRRCYFGSWNGSDAFGARNRRNHEFPNPASPLGSAKHPSALVHFDPSRDRVASRRQASPSGLRSTRGGIPGGRNFRGSDQRRRRSMKWNMIVGALVLGLGLCSNSYGFNLLDSMLGAHGGGCGCEASCGCEAVGPGCGCEAVAPGCGCEAPACNSCCSKRGGLFSRCNKSCCASACEPACGCEAAGPSCGCEAAACGSGCCKKRCRRGLLDLFGCNRGCCKPTCAPACEPACGCEAACEPACGCAAACEPACCAPKSCCKQRCCRRGLFDGLHGLFDRPCKKCCKSSCRKSCGCAPSCGCVAGNGCGAVFHGNGNGSHADEAVPMPPAPMADPSASLPNRRVNAAAFTARN